MLSLYSICGTVFMCVNARMKIMGGIVRKRNHVAFNRMVVKRQHCGCPTWSPVDEVEVYRSIRRIPPGSSITAAERRDKTLG